MDRSHLIQYNGYDYMPKWFSNKSMACYFIVLIVISILWNQFTMDGRFLFVSMLSVVAFFFIGNVISKKWRHLSNEVYCKHIFISALLIRLLWIIYVCFFNVDYFETITGDVSDTGFYIDCAKECAEGLSSFDFSFINRWLIYYKIALDDFGYPITLGIVYFFTGGISDVIVPFIVKSVLGAYTCVLIFNIAKRHFNDNVAKIAAIFCALNPNMIWWCGSMMKETEMVFFSIWFIENFDGILVQKHISLKQMIIGFSIGMVTFFYRSALGAVAFASMFFAILMSNNKSFTLSKKIIIGIVTIGVFALGIGNTMLSRVSGMVENVQSGGQQTNMDWRANREGGNSFAKYAGAAVFAPLIFTIPFPTLAMANENQYSQMQMSGGNFIKNISSAFVIYSMVLLLLSGEWRKHTLPLSFMLAYLIVLVFSGYAQSGRFHMPIWPIEMMFAAYGLCILPKKRVKYFNYVVIFEFVVCMGWQWFKLKGRGLI